MIINANALSIPLAAKSVHTIVTSPPYYGLRDYGVDGQIGLEVTPDAYIANLVAVFRECKRILRDDGTLWVNIGDSYASNGEKSNNNGEGKSTMGWTNQKHETLNKVAGMKLPAINHGCKPKDLIGIPWMLAFALRADGWYLRQDIIWAKPNPMPESVKDRCTKSHEYIFLLSKSAKYHYDNEAIKEVATGYDGRKDTMMKGSAEYGGEGSRAVDTQERRYGVRRWTRKNDGTGYGGDGTGFQDHSGYSNLENPYVRNKRDVWTVTTKPYKGAHYATFNPELIKPCILAGAPEGGIVFDPFVGSGTTVATAMQLGRKGIGLDLSLKYLHENASVRINEARLPLLESL